MNSGSRGKHDKNIIFAVGSRYTNTYCWLWTYEFKNCTGHCLTKSFYWDLSRITINQPNKRRNNQSCDENTLRLELVTG